MVKDVCLQVSHVPADMSARWNKQRRFQEAWRWVRALRKSISHHRILPLVFATIFSRTHVVLSLSSPCLTHGNGTRAELVLDYLKSAVM